MVSKTVFSFPPRVARLEIRYLPTQLATFDALLEQLSGEFIKAHSEKETGIYISYGVLTDVVYQWLRESEDCELIGNVGNLTLDEFDRLVQYVWKKSGDGSPRKGKKAVQEGPARSCVIM